MSTHPISILPNFIVGFISTASLDQKQCLLNMLTEEISQDPYTDILPRTAMSEPSVSEENSVSESEPPPDCVTVLNNDRIPPSSHSLQTFVPPIFSDLVQHIPELEISEDLSSGLLNELNSLKLRSRGNKGNPAKVKTQWLSPGSTPYNYGKVINNPKPISNFPNVVKLMEQVNSHPSTSGNMSACLVSCMSTAKSSLNYHTDDEDIICQDSDICTFSIGPPRSLEFIKSSQSKGRKEIPPPPEFSVPAGNHSLNIMRAGCQQKLMHRVPQGKDSGVRYSLSFRRIVPPSLCDHSSVTTSEPQPETIPLPSKTATLKHTPAKKVTLLAGDSYFARLDTTKLSKGKEEVFNIAVGGRKISQVENDIKSFIGSHPDLEIKTLFISIGTNDIRNCKQGINHLKPVLANFMKNIKSLVPYTRIFLQSLLPIPANGNPKAEVNVISMNNLIYNLCSRYKLFFIDVFSSFLNSHGNRNLKLFPGYDNSMKLLDIHPNKRGMGVLAKHYIFLIHSKWFNPMGY